jgi:2-(1,2-epoxy-1,2-dihydrophenyl)acetyl-CoA isomerase
LLSDVIDAQTALQFGLVNRVVPAADLERETSALATRLAQGPTLAYGRIRRLLRESHQNDLATQLRSERDAFVVGTRTKDFAEGLTAFFEKRPPKYTGT